MAFGDCLYGLVLGELAELGQQVRPTLAPFTLFTASCLAFTSLFTRLALRSLTGPAVLFSGSLLGLFAGLPFTAFTLGCLSFTGLFTGRLLGGLPPFLAFGTLALHAGFVLATCGALYSSRLPLLTGKPFTGFTGLPLATLACLPFGFAFGALLGFAGFPFGPVVNALFMLFTLDAGEGCGDGTPVSQSGFRRDDQQGGGDEVNTHTDHVA